MKPFSDSKKSISFRLFDTVWHIARTIDHTLLVNNIPLAGDQVPLLMLSAQWEGSSINDLAKIIEKDKAGILRGLRSLEKQGLIRLQDAAADRRKRLVFLTPKGYALVERIMKELKKIDINIKKGITSAERKNFYKVLCRICDNCLAFPRKEGNALEASDFVNGIEKNTTKHR